MEKPMDEWPAMAENVRIELRFQGMCKTCAEQGRRVHVCVWISCPTGGWWSHREHPDDNHDAEIGWQPEEAMDDQGHVFTVGEYTPGGTAV
ncbi:hypothetical protein BKG60_04820 [Mycobacterium syngnathidarum]|nr:hypothetical protein BKG60_04820 [Mycobacterium syngnathidarum]